MLLVRRYGWLKLSMAICDLVLAWAAGMGALWRLPTAPLGTEWAFVAGAGFLVIPVFRLLDLYKLRIWLVPAAQAVRLASGTAVVLAIAFLAWSAARAWPPPHALATGAVWWLLWGALFVAVRLLASGGVLGLSRLTPMLSRHAVLIGAGEAAAAFLNTVGPDGLVGVVFDGALDDDPAKTGGAVGTVPVLGTTALLPELAGRGVADAYVAIDVISHERLLALIHLCQECRVNVRLFTRHFAVVGASDWDRESADLQVVSLYARPLRSLQWRIKRVLDLVLAAAGLAVLSPLMLLVAALVRLTSPGPALYVSTAVGRGEHEFPFYKFRSMLMDAEDIRHRELIDAIVRNPDERFGKLEDDERVTPLGRWLRKASFDEWPQLLNVVRGEMSLVGPRPSKPYELGHYQAWHRHRFSVRPGITGLWQVTGRARVSFNEMVAMDLYYIENFSLWLDLVILLRTVLVVLEGRGAV